MEAFVQTRFLNSVLSMFLGPGSNEQVENTEALFLTSFFSINKSHLYYLLINHVLPPLSFLYLSGPPTAYHNMPK